MIVWDSLPPLMQRKLAPVFAAFSPEGEMAAALPGDVDCNRYILHLFLHGERPSLYTVNAHVLLTDANRRFLREWSQSTWAFETYADESEPRVGPNGTTYVLRIRNHIDVTLHGETVNGMFITREDENGNDADHITFHYDLTPHEYEQVRDWFGRIEFDDENYVADDADSVGSTDSAASLF